MKTAQKIATCLVESALMMPGGNAAAKAISLALTRAKWLRKLDRVRLFNLVATRIKTNEPVRTKISLLGHPELAVDVELDLSDELSRYWYYFGYDYYEVPVCRLLTALIDRLASERVAAPKVLLDVGGNLGYYTLMMAALAKRSCSDEVHAFEPSPRVFQLLQRNVALNAELRITINELAVCDDEGEQRLFIASEDFGHSSASLVAGSIAQIGSVLVKSTTLDTYVAGLGDRPVALLKMDCEGVEAKVLSGMRRMLDRDSPHIVMEVLPRYPSLPSDLAQQPFFSRYRKFHITEAGLVEHDEIKPSYENRDWLLSVDPPSDLFVKGR